MSGDNVVVGRNIEGAPIDPMQSQTVAFSHYNNFSAQLPVDPETGELVEGGVQDQAAQCLDNIEAIACGIDHALSDVVRLTVFVKDVRDIAAVDEVVSAYFPAYVPARTNVVANEAPVSRLSAQTVAFSHYNNVSAQLGIDPKTGRLVEGGVREQTVQCLRNVKAILASIDVPFDDIVKVNVFLKDLGDLDAVNEAYSTFFPDSGIARAAGYVPARTVVEVADLEMGALVQVEAVVSHGDGTPPQEVEARHGLIIEASNTDAAPRDPLATQSVAFSHYNNVSAQLGIDPATGGLVAGGAREQAAQCLRNIKAVIESVGHSMDDAVKVNVFLKDLADMDAVNEAYADFFPEGVPARRFVGVRNLPKDALVQIDAIFGNAEGTPPTA